MGHRSVASRVVRLREDRQGGVEPDAIQSTDAAGAAAPPLVLEPTELALHRTTAPVEPEAALGLGAGSVGCRRAYEFQPNPPARAPSHFLIRVAYVG